MKKLIFKDDNVFVYATEKGCYKISIENDSDCESPRAWDNLGIIIAFGSHSYISDNDPTLKGNKKVSDFWDDPKEFTQYHKKEDWIILPLYKTVYEHSGVKYQTTSFSCRWDSGQIGYIYTSIDAAKEEFGEDYKEKAIECLKGEVKTFSNWANGQCYGFNIEFASIEQIKEHENIVFAELPPLEDSERWEYHVENDFNGIEFEDFDSCWGYIEDIANYEDMYVFTEALSQIE